MATVTATAATYPKCDKGSASVVFFYTADDAKTVFFQETIKLKKAMEGYNKVVLLKHDSIPNFLDLSEADEKIADKILTPTKTNFFKAITDLAKEGYYIDIWILGHGKNEKFICSAGTNGSVDYIENDDINTEMSSSKTGLTTMPIRMVYQGVCYGSTLNNNWKAAGAKVSIGTRYVDYYPIQYSKFAEEWNKKTIKVKDALDSCNTSSSRTLVQVYLANIFAPTHNKEWGSCPLFQTILGDNSCAKEFHTHYYLRDSDWQSSKNGKENMNYSSTWLTDGDSSITKNTKPSWR
ncbi:MAG: hypothetical protein ACRDEB_06490 [Chitinophagaceae bacterium]